MEQSQKVQLLKCCAETVKYDHQKNRIAARKKRAVARKKQGLQQGKIMESKLHNMQNGNCKTEERWIESKERRNNSNAMNELWGMKCRGLVIQDWKWNA